MAKDIFHQHVKQLLINEGWTVTHDPYLIRSENKIQYQIDLGAEKIVAAERGSEKIAVEIKSFLSESLISDFHEALGQYLNYRVGIEEVEAERTLFLALPEQAYTYLSGLPLAMRSLEVYKINLIVYKTSENTIVLWKM